MQATIEMERVWKTFGTVTAVRGLSLSVPPGSIYGFLGPNGAGKSTTIRMLLGLQRPSSGKILVFGHELKNDRIEVLRRVGSLVESPSLYLHLTGRENLEIYQRLVGLPKATIEESLRIVDLQSAADRLVRGYSLGMKQRLGIAQALLGSPELLLLDEPTNGLDPAGIYEIRLLIQHLSSRRGVTIFLSSHLLSEVEQLATHLAIVSKGEMRFEGTPDQLTKSKKSRSVILDVDHPQQAHAILSKCGLDVSLDQHRVSVASDLRYDAAAINAMLVQAGVCVSSLTTRSLSLEELFLDLTNADNQPAETIDL